MVLPWVHEPGVTADQVEEEYDVKLDEGMVWRNAPCLRSTAAAVRAENDRELERRGRVVQVETTVRIEPLKSSGPALAERVAEPVGAPLGRLVWTATQFWKGMPTAALWTLLEPDEVVALEVAKVPNQEDALSLIYRAPVEALGKEVSFEVDGRVEHTELVALRSGRFALNLAAGSRRVVLRGAAGLFAFASAPPSRGGTAFKRQLVYELPPGASRDFRFQRDPDELVALFVSVVREDGRGPFELQFEIDPGRLRLEERRLVRRVTIPRGTASGRASEDVLLSDLEASAERPLPHALGRTRIVVGDDLTPGAHVLRLRSEGSQNGRLWVRAVVAGRKVARQSGSAEDEP
jgi:hypothetical protein